MNHNTLGEYVAVFIIICMCLIIVADIFFHAPRDEDDFGFRESDFLDSRSGST